MVIVVTNFSSVTTLGLLISGISSESLSIKPKDFKYFNWISDPNLSAIFAEPILLE